MKDYKEIAKNVLRRGLEEMERSRRRKRALVRGGCTAAALGLVAVISMGAFWGKGRQQEKDSSGQLASAENMEVIKNPASDGAFAGDVSGLDGGQGDLTGKDATMDGDPSGYGVGAGKDAIGSLGEPSGYEPVPGGRTDWNEKGETDPESNQKAPVVENSHPAWTEEAVLPNGQNSASESAADEEFLPGGAVDGGIATTTSKKMISSYPEDAVYCYAAPKNGEFFCSAPLVHAMEEYGDEVLYRVVVEIFRDGNMVREQVTERISGEEKLEWSRLEELGYMVAWEQYDDGQEQRRYFMLHATKEQLEEFAVNEEYGYMLRFFDEP